MKIKTFASFSFGCRVNQAEREELDRKLLSSGFVYDLNNPFLYIINTCAVTEKAEREARQHIYQARKKFPLSKIIVTGCAATKWIKDKVKVFGADEFIDNTNKEYVAELLLNKFNTNKTVSEKYAVKDKFIDSGRYILKIQDGCQRFCSYCIVPYLRGIPKSRKISELIRIIKTNEKTIKELILTAINTEAFGYDTGENFITLIDQLIKSTSVQRVSLGSIHPWSITSDFLEYYKKINSSGRLVNYFHIPLQSGSDKILNLMKRGYKRDEILVKLFEIKKINSTAFIGTDIITGFLEEDDQDFEDTYNFLEKSPIDKLHVFRFSIREKTAAYHMAKRLSCVGASMQQKRSRALISLGKKKYALHLEKHIGRVYKALFLKDRRESVQSVLLENQTPAYIKTEKDLTGCILDVKITGITKGVLVGESE
ncbi:MAG: Protein YqeV [Candidatus Gottesmanbacteria bacterium GW2011_GWC2_39_8]|uniref:Protein YqeV n=1 Tax=Candidatus Gottesmanbacteria bacterium GW2011_GWC2_39_8 TaxID=1618450 RepID=A0A0G0PT84_9BACT|nr:MAG: Protein YqeV [Candidatus Gottesmanbacteria bacterium GW2011_GWC2_39_8]